MSRICIDLDGVIAQLRQPNQTYEDIEPIPGAPEKLKALKAAGHYLIIFTARHMKTCDGNPGRVVARLGKITMDWLEKYDIPFDEIHFGKPWADVYIDDNAFRFTSWEALADDGSDLPRSKEKQLQAVK
jgi:capsule biosynthesis phosphatase